MKIASIFFFTLLYIGASDALADDCEQSVLAYSQNKPKQYLLSTRVSLPTEFQATGTLEIIGFRCMSTIKSGRPINMVMGKGMPLPQFDVIYTDSDGIRFSNIMQALAMPWGDVVEIDMVSTVVLDILKHFKSFKRQTLFDQRVLYQELREASAIRAWAKLRAIRISQNPLKYAYPLPANEVKLMEQSKLAYERLLKHIHQNHLKNVIEQPESLLDNFLRELSQEKPRKQVLAGMSKLKPGKGSFLDDLAVAKIGLVNNIVTMRKNPLDGQAVYKVHYVGAEDEVNYVRKVKMKRVGNKWYISAVNKPKRI